MGRSSVATMMHRYWFRFALPPEQLPIGAAIGCGVTAPTLDDALRLLRERIFAGVEMPEPAQIIENVDVSLLDDLHVAPNIGDVVVEGVWFPLGY